MCTTFLQLGERHWSAFPTPVPHFAPTASSSDAMLHSPSLQRRWSWKTVGSLGTAWSIKPRSCSRLPYLTGPGEDQAVVPGHSSSQILYVLVIWTQFHQLSRRGGGTVPGLSSTWRDKPTEAQAQPQKSWASASCGNNCHPQNKNGCDENSRNDNASHSVVLEGTGRRPDQSSGPLMCFTSTTPYSFIVSHRWLGKQGNSHPTVCSPRNFRHLKEKWTRF